MESMDDFVAEEWAEDEVAPLFSGEMLNLDLEEMTPEQIATAWAFLDAVEKTAKKRKSVLREKLMSLAETDGNETDKGGYSIRLNGTYVVAEKRRKKLPDETMLREYLKEQDIPFDKVFTPKTEVVLDASKLQMLIDLGELDEDEVLAMRKEHYALKVRPSTKLDELLVEAASGYEPLEMPAKNESKPKAPRVKKSKASGPRKKG